jgi:tetratricopeptide (TPR) repeat protein
MPKVFISHSTLDREFVEREIIPPLRTHGIETWYSTDNIRTAELWEKSIREGLKSCDWFLIVMSPNSVGSKWVPREMLWAMDRREGRIIPVLIETCAPEDLHLGLLAIQHIDFRHNLKKAQSELLSIWGVSNEVNDLYQEALAEVRKANWAGAIARLKKLLDLSPNHAEAKYELRQAQQQKFLAGLYEAGLIHFKGKRWQESLDDLRQVEELGGEYEDVVSLIAKAEHELAKIEEERKTQELKAQQLKAQEVEAQELATRLPTPGPAERINDSHTDESIRKVDDATQPPASSQASVSPQTPVSAPVVVPPVLSPATIPKPRASVAPSEMFAGTLDQPVRKAYRLVWIICGGSLIALVLFIVISQIGKNGYDANNYVTSPPDFNGRSSNDSTVGLNNNSGNNMNNSSLSNSALVQGDSSPSPTPTPTTVQLRLTQVESTDASIDSPLEGTNIIIRAGVNTFQKKTNSRGAAVFDDVPCGEVVEITAYDTRAEHDKVFKRKIGCDKPQVEFVLDEPMGGFPIELVQRKPARPRYYDAEKNKWHY